MKEILSRIEKIENIMDEDYANISSIVMYLREIGKELSDGTYLMCEEYLIIGYVQNIAFEILKNYAYYIDMPDEEFAEYVWRMLGMGMYSLISFLEKEKWELKMVKGSKE